MSVQLVLDLTENFNANSSTQFDVGGFDYAIAQFIDPVGSITFFSSNDSGDIEGVSDGSAISAENFFNIVGTKLDNNGNAASINSSSIVRFEKVGRYLKFTGGTGATVGRLLVRLYKIN